MEEKKSASQAQPGPIAAKIIRSAAKYAKSKMIDWPAWKSAKPYDRKLKKGYQNKDFSHLDPLHAIYIDVQHRVVDFMDQIFALPEYRKLSENYGEAEDIYMPSYPPMSPITESYFWCWSALDMGIGIKPETPVTIIIDCCKALGTSPEWIAILQNMQQSRTGLYLNEGNDKKFVYLRDIYTQEVFKTYPASGYLGDSGELWLVRLLPDPFDQLFDYAVAFTTPYIIIDYPLGKKAEGDFRKLRYSEHEWVEFIKRNLPNLKNKDAQQAYHHLMKYGLNKHYWLEYIFQAFVNSTSNAIWLTGFPDKPESLPHSDENFEKRF